jgi:hypothetical protein
MQMAASTVPMTTISILLDNSLPWEWVVDNSDASGQIFYGVPIVVSNALNISLNSIKTVALQAYQTTNSTGGSEILTVYLGQLPTTHVDALSAMLQTPTSPIYDQPGLPGQLAQTFVPSFSVKSFASEKSASSSNSGASSGSLDDGSSDDSGSGSGGLAKSTKIIIAVVVTGGVILIAIAGYFAWRATRTGAVKLSSPRVSAQRDFGGSGEMSQSGNGGLRSFYLGGSPTGSPYGTWRSGGGNSAGRRDSISTTSTTSTASGSYGSRSGSGGSGDDRRSSWWRFSDHSSSNGGGGGGHRSSSGAGFGGGPGQVGLALGGGDTHREGPRRVQIMRGPNGSVAPGIIGRYEISLCLLLRAYSIADLFRFPFTKQAGRTEQFAHALVALL